MASQEQLTHYPLGDRALVFVLGDGVSLETNKRIQQICSLLKDQPLNGILEFVPAFTTITIYYDPCILTYQKIIDYIILLNKHLPSTEDEQHSIKEIPVFYNGEDLAYVASCHNLSTEEVISIHSQVDYIVHMIGFTPGFPYLGGMDTRITTVRKQIPRLHVPAGSVGIGGEQSGIYSQDSPAGWQIIGHTPIQLFDINKEQPSLLQAGDIVRFVPITEDQYQILRNN